MAFRSRHIEAYQTWTPLCDMQKPSLLRKLLVDLKFGVVLLQVACFGRTDVNSISSQTKGSQKFRSPRRMELDCESPRTARKPQNLIMTTCALLATWYVLSEYF